MDELDLALINAVQLRPRAPWSEMAEPLGVDAATLSRRWTRLTETGAAWVTCYPGNSQVQFGAIALMEVCCRPGTSEAVAERIARHPYPLTVEITSGDRDLILTVAAASSRALSDYVLRVISREPDVTAVRTMPVVGAYREASRWRLDSLDPVQRTTLQTDRSTDKASPRSLAEDRRLLLALGENGRMPITEISERTGLPATTLRRRIDHLTKTGRAVLRCDFAHEPAGWRAQVMLWLRAIPNEQDRIADALVQMSTTRACWALAGRANLGLYLWLHTMQDLPHIEREITRRFPTADVIDRAVTLRVVKRTGRMLDQSGRATSHVPMDVWSEPLVSSAD
ncbi:Lrp/AsnC family transcriptional regulator [Rhodococcus erythropolis]|uniref:Lrp/AsnC family transcriptional regulator n=1 Tax=Rhodococcus erythropolis TaxID=1833 RepID=UPI002949AD66|nr:Lrp/AsnC family transcriptional regulator [Rhodococcus erythropolis]MDV6277781.1 Lrp/AsnC family transcriptional regulator [Rhodococcus erythropolis]